MKCRRFLLLLVGVIAVLTPLAYTSPPDPSWIRGLYDDADLDDVVVFLTSSVGIVGPFILSDLRPVLRVAGPLLPTEQESTTTRPFSANPSRAPPAL